VHARSTTIQATPSSIDAGVRHIQDEVLPALTDVDGFTGLSTLVDRKSGRCIVTTAWQSEDAMHASAELVLPIRDRAAQRFGADTAEVDEWEIDLLHREHNSGDGAVCRVTWVRGDPANLDRATEVFRMVSLPVLQEASGFCSASLMVNRSTGLGVTSVVYQSRKAMDQAKRIAEDARQRATARAGVTILEVREFELALAHLRVPEMA
jgi:quinol monooxygenase YgiN